MLRGQSPSYWGKDPADQRSIARSALLHDVGKAFIPLSILDKPGKLTEGEMSEVKKHPRLGHDLLVQQGGFPEEILIACCTITNCSMDPVTRMAFKAIRSRTLSASSPSPISSLRLLKTERIVNHYSPSAALSIMYDMGNKLDVDLLHAFRSVVDHII